MTYRLAGLCLILASGCAKTPTRSDCEKLLDHIVELEMASGGVAAAATPEARASREAQKTKVLGYVGTDFVGSCVKELPQAQLECGLAAKTQDELGRCDGT
jgi:hypothetical protein